jgi:hypothetical protein
MATRVVIPNYRNIPSPAQRGRARVGADFVTRCASHAPIPAFPRKQGKGTIRLSPCISSKQDEHFTRELLLICFLSAAPLLRVIPDMIFSPIVDRRPLFPGIRQ